MVEPLIRKFLPIVKRGTNVLDSNLTELLAAESVDRGFINHNDWLAHVLRYQFVLNSLTNKGTENILDVGCGQLQFPYYAYRNRYPPVKSYWGIDLRATENWLENAGWHTPTYLVRADFATDAEKIEALLDWPGQFDVVIYLEAHEHVGTEDFQWEAMANIHEWLRPGGLLFFSTPNAGVSDSTAANHLNAEGQSREWTYQDKVKLLQDNDFEIVASYGTFGAVRRLPAEAYAQPAINKAREFLSTSMFTNFAFIAYPEHANNAVFACRRK